MQSMKQKTHPTQPPTSETERHAFSFFKERESPLFRSLVWNAGESGSGKLFIVASRKHTSVFSMLDPTKKEEQQHKESLDGFYFPFFVFFLLLFFFCFFREEKAKKKKSNRKNLAEKKKTREPSRKLLSSNWF
jgi:preprotein translocase subunit YajC